MWGAVLIYPMEEPIRVGAFWQSKLKSSNKREITAIHLALK
jgi:hypothetical protein